MLAKSASARSLTTRFLVPFAFRAAAAPGAAGALCSASIAGRERVWRSAEAPWLYRDDALPQAHALLFGPGCACLRVADEFLNSWFHGARVKSRDLELPVSAVPGPGIELFLLGCGVGVLSVTLAPDVERLDAVQALSFNYRIARRPPRDLAAFELPHPAADAAAWARIPAENRARIAPAPAADAPLAARLGARGGSFTLPELVEALLAPLSAFGRAAGSAYPCAYSVARFGEEVDFDRADVRDALSPVLSALAQLEEPTHAGMVGGELPLPNALLNRRHWAAAGLLGAAHLVADQPAPEGRDAHPFNEERVHRSRDKYFIPYLAALVQRTFLQRVLDEAAAVGQLGDAQARADRLSALHAELLSFSLAGDLAQVSTRHAVHRFYGVAREGLDVPAFRTQMRNALAEIDAGRHIAAQQRETSGMARNMRTMVRMQSALEVIEVFLVAVYGAHLYELISHNGKYAAVAGLLAGVAASAFLYWRNHGAHGGHGEPERRAAPQAATATEPQPAGSDARADLEAA